MPFRSPGRRRTSTSSDPRLPPERRPPKQQRHLRENSHEQDREGHQGDQPPTGAQGRRRARRPRRGRRRGHRLPHHLGAEPDHAAPVRHRRVEPQCHRREVQGRSRHHPADDRAGFRRGVAARRDAGQQLRHRRHRILDLQEGVPGRHAAADGCQEDQVLRPDRADLHHRQADPGIQRSRRAPRRTASPSSTARTPRSSRKSRRSG